MKFEWDTAVKLVTVERARLIESLMNQHGIDDTQLIRGQISALKWVLNLPVTQLEEEQFEMQRQEAEWLK